MPNPDPVPVDMALFRRVIVREIERFNANRGSRALGLKKGENRNEAFDRLAKKGAAGAVSPLQRMERVLMQSFPFKETGPRVLFIVDECQHLNAKVIECLRGLFDLGRYARDFDLSAPAFGLLLVGNGHFLSRGGDEMQSVLAAHGERFGNLRVMDTAVDLARHFAGENDMTLACLQKAFLFSAGGK